MRMSHPAAGPEHTAALWSSSLRLSAPILLKDRAHGAPWGPPGAQPEHEGAACQQHSCRALTKARKARREQCTAWAETKRPPAASPEALSNPLQAAKKQMRDSSVGHQAPSGAQGVPQTAPSRDMACQGYATLQPSPPLSEARQHPGAAFHPCSIHILRRLGSTKACPAPAHRLHPAHQPSPFPTHSLLFCFVFSLQDAQSRSFHDLTIPMAAHRQPSQLWEAAARQGAAVSSSSQAGRGTAHLSQQHHPRATQPWGPADMWDALKSHWDAAARSCPSLLHGDSKQALTFLCFLAIHLSQLLSMSSHLDSRCRNTSRGTSSSL